MGLATADIVAFLNVLCKTSLSPAIRRHIEDCTRSYGKVRVFLSGQLKSLRGEGGRWG